MAALLAMAQEAGIPAVDGRLLTYRALCTEEQVRALMTAWEKTEGEPDPEYAAVLAGKYRPFEALKGPPELPGHTPPSLKAGRGAGASASAAGGAEPLAGGSGAPVPYFGVQVTSTCSCNLKGDLCSCVQRLQT